LPASAASSLADRTQTSNGRTSVENWNCRRVTPVSGRVAAVLTFLCVLSLIVYLVVHGDTVAQLLQWLS